MLKMTKLLIIILMFKSNKKPSYIKNYKFVAVINNNTRIVKNWSIKIISPSWTLCNQLIHIDKSNDDELNPYLLSFDGILLSFNGNDSYKGEINDIKLK